VRRLVPLALTAALLAPLVSVTPASAASKAIWGPVQLPDGSSAFELYRTLGVDVFELPLLWRTTAPRRPARPRDPNDPAYLWPGDLTYAVSEGQKYGIKVAPMVIQTPPWANGGRTPNWAPTKSSDFADFLTAASRRYPTIRHWMIWGEPSRRDLFQPMPTNRRKGPRRYARLLEAAYVALKRESRSNIVIGANTFTVGDVLPRDFVKWMRLPSGLPPRLDWWGHNPFSTRFPRLKQRPYARGARDLSDIDTLDREVRRAYRSRRKRPKLWLSEFTVVSDHGSDQFNFYVSRSAQARWLSAAFRLARRERSVAGLGWYQLYDTPGPSGDRTWGLLTTSGQRKPAFYAYQRARG
jgi:hypothetical protein